MTTTEILERIGENPDKVEGNSHAGKWQKVNK